MPSQATPAAVRKQIASGALAPIYVLVGDDEVEKSTLAMEFGESVDEDIRPFNVERFHGVDASLQQVVDAARTMPFGAGRRIVLALQAERMLEPKRAGAAVTRGLEALEGYLNDPVPQTTLVIAVSRLDRRTRLSRLLLRQSVEVECDGGDVVDNAPQWVRAALADAGLQPDADAVRLIVERAGDQIARLRAEVERVKLFAAGQRRVSREDVEAVVGPAVAGDQWAVTQAIQRGQAREALNALALSLDSGAVPFMVLGQLAWFVRTRYPQDRVARVIDAVFETDLALKSSAGEPRVLLERLVVLLCDGISGRAPDRDRLRSR